jgi:dephospho-CoA kinase
MKAIVITGMPGSGKSQASRIAEEMGIQVFRMGDLVREEVLSLPMRINGDVIGKVANDMREKYGKDIWARKILKKIEKGKEKEEKIVIDGVRNIEEIKAFKEKMDVIIVTIHASPSTRYERLIERKRMDDPTVMKKFIQRDERDLGWGIGEVIAMADLMIINEGSIDEFREKVEEILLKL